MNNIMIDYNKLIEIYSEHFNYYGYKPNKCDLGQRYLEVGERRAHINYMLEQMKTETDEGKLNRWLGFIQGALWFDYRYSIDELREHVNSCKIDYTWSAPAGFNRGLGLERLEQLTRLVHDDIANDVTTELIDPEEQKTYNELYQIHTNLMKEFRDK